MTESKMVSTIISPSRRVRSPSWVTSSTRSALVMVLSSSKYKVTRVSYIRCSILMVHRKQLQLRFACGSQVSGIQFHQNLVGSMKFRLDPAVYSLVGLQMRQLAAE